jgi:multidrug efflux pump subunit AcrA (membrane-fusion protein)
MKYKSKKITPKRLIWAAVALVVAGGAAKYFWPAGSSEVKSPVQTVTTFVVEQRDFPVIVDATGSTVASNIVDIRPQVTNVVAQVHIKEG